MKNPQLWSIISFITLISLTGLGVYLYEPNQPDNTNMEESLTTTTTLTTQPIYTEPWHEIVNGSTGVLLNNSIPEVPLINNTVPINPITNTTETNVTMVQLNDYVAVSHIIDTLQADNNLRGNFGLPFDTTIAWDNWRIGTNSILYHAATTSYYVAYSVTIHATGSAYDKYWVTWDVAQFDASWNLTTSICVEGIVFEVTAFDLFQPLYPAIRFYDSGTKFYVAWPFGYIATPYAAAVKTAIYTIGTTTWVRNDNAFANSKDMQGYDLNAVSANPWEQYYFGANNGIGLASKVYFGDGVDFNDNETSAGYESRAWKDTSDGSLYWLKSNAGAVTLRKLTTGGVFSEVETISATTGTDLSMATALYWKQGTVEVALWKNNLWYKASATASWKQVANITADNPIPHWEYNLSSNIYSINAFTFGSYYITLENNTVLIQNVTDITASFAWHDYIGSDSGDGYIYQLTATAKYYPPSFPVTYGYGKIPTAYFTPPFQGETYFANQYMKVYTDTGTLAYQGYIEKRIMENTRTRYLIPIIHPAQYELLQNVIINETGKTWAEIITSAIQDNCKIMTVGSITSLATTYDLVNWRLRLIDLLMIADYIENYRWYINPDCSIDRDNGATSTTYSITDAAGNPFGNVQDLPTYIQYSKCIVKGSLGTTDGTYNANANEYGALQLNFPCIDDSTILQAIADMVGPQMNQTFKKYTLESKTQKIFLPGQTCVLNSTANAITNGTYNITEMTLDLISHTVTLAAQNGLSFPQQTDLGVNAFTNQQQISKTYNMLKSEDLSIAGIKSFENIHSEVITVDSSISATVDDYKRGGAVDWGTSGTPTGWTAASSPATNEVVTYASHSACVHIIGTAGAYRGIYRAATLSAGYISAFVYPSQLNSVIQFMNHNVAETKYLCSFQFASDGFIKYLNAEGSDHISTGIIYESRMYHLLIDWTKNSTVRYYIDGVLVATVTSTVNYDIDTTSILGYHPTNATEFYFDAFYTGIDYKSAWASLYPDAIKSRTLVDSDGFKFLHKTDEVDAYNQAATNMPTGATTIVPYASVLSNTIGSWDGDRFTCQIAGMYAIQACVFMASTAYTAGERMILLIKNGGTIIYQTEMNIDANVTKYVNLTVTGMIRLAVSNYIEIFLYNGHSADIVLFNGSIYANTLQITRLY